VYAVGVNTRHVDRGVQDGRYQIVKVHEMHKDRCGLSQLYLWYASKGSSLVLLYTVSIGGRVCLGE
jgi:hypothetical protein